MMFVTAEQLHELILSDEEFAVLDVREREPFSKEHILLSNCVPYGRLETMLPDFVPRLSTKVVVVSQGPADVDSLSAMAASRLRELKYTDVSILRDGISGWRKAGYDLFSGVHVLSKSFGEIAAVEYKTPFISANDEFKKIKNNDKHVILDCRPYDEYHCMTIPRSVNVPGVELVYRVHDIVPDDQTLVVVHCAGRTRSIIAAQSLINAGLPNPVMALENGTMGWQLAGLELEYGQDRVSSPPTPKGLAKAKACAARMAERFGVRKIKAETLREWLDETGHRTTYVLDIRLPEEFEAGHVPGARNIQGGQLIQASNEYIAVHNSRVVFLDDTEVRATVAASWLIQLGWSEVYVLEGGIGGFPLVKGPAKARVLGFAPGQTISCGELSRMLKDKAEQIAVLDLAWSNFFKHNHIPGAVWGNRSTLGQDIGNLPAVDTLVLTSENSDLAHLAAADLKKMGLKHKLLVLGGGTKAWIKAGLPTAQGLKAISQVNDIWYMPYMFPDAPDKAKRDYLAWEIALVDQVAHDGTAKFRKFPKQ